MQKAVILAAGPGTRLAPITDVVPKILAPLAGRPLLEHQLAYLARQGIGEVAVNVHHRAEAVCAFLGAHDLPVHVRVSVEPELLGTAGALHQLRDFISGPTVVLYGDVLTDANLGALVAAHTDRGAVATLTYYLSSSLEGKGFMELGADERVQAFVEKSDSPPKVGYVNAGLYAVSPVVLDYVRPGSDFGHDVWPEMLAAGEPLYGHALDGYLRDIGSPDALEHASADLADGALRW
jgi:NDP-sugar pyrophosphorylase family protein